MDSPFDREDGDDLVDWEQSDTEMQDGTPATCESVELGGTDRMDSVEATGRMARVRSKPRGKRGQCFPRHRESVGAKGLWVHMEGDCWQQTRVLLLAHRCCAKREFWKERRVRTGLEGQGVAVSGELFGVVDGDAGCPRWADMRRWLRAQEAAVVTKDVYSVQA
ncbi:hypothetical protein BDP55DRAFT_733936 [Colletotrichum godetiae]|uniref:Uncharacterized protein n=1 Tax=Colletotrichum godetiae TaxID=1209918 RepID=A0AAJ0ABT0_9PEZI|nr:uncharacterized protein BDP55DRAFT_733936 [Colletotrichum godetiae]KAK1658691.1 hypothetical protein BDP55DRAFT_733936 [Colletotrichum godetiae]